MKRSAATPEGRIRQFCILRARQHGHDAQWVRERATELFRLPAVEGFCLTALDKPQLIQLADHVVQLTGGAPSVHRRGPRGARREQRDRTGVVTYLATQEQRHLIFALAEEIFGGTESPAFSGFLIGMTGKSDCRLLARNQASKTIEALTAMQRRGWRPRRAQGDAETRRPGDAEVKNG